MTSPLLKSIELHNVAEAIVAPVTGGWLLSRYPAKIISELSSLGRHAATTAVGVEIRFHGPTDWVSITLSARCPLFFSKGAEVEIWRGNHQLTADTVHIYDGETRTIPLRFPPGFAELPEELLRGGPFSPDWWRLRLGGASVILRQVDSGGQIICPPVSEEKPSSKWLAYSSSITNASPGYAAMTAELLGVDLLNKELSGSCLCEESVSDYLTTEDRDHATLELGVNMRGQEICCDDFLERVSRFVRRLRELTAISRDPHLFLIDGGDLLNRPDGLSADGVHPSPSGHARIAVRLADKLKTLLQPYQLLPSFADSLA